MLVCRKLRNNSVLLSDGTELDADMVLLSIGTRPELTLAKAADLEIGESGGLVVDETMRTNDSGHLCCRRYDRSGQ